MAHMQSSKCILEKFAEILSDVAVVEKSTKGRRKKHDYVFDGKTLIRKRV